MKDPKVIITKEVVEMVNTEGGLTTELSELEDKLSDNPIFNQFIQKQAELNYARAKAADAWKKIETQMIEHDIKKIDTNQVSLTIAERLDFDIDDEVLAPRYKKTVADTSKIRTIYQLDRKPISGATPRYKRYLVKRLKVGGNNEQN
jgi:hypothetical protein